MVGAPRTFILGLAALSLLWAAGLAPAMAQGARRTADNRAGLADRPLAPPPDAVPTSPRAAPVESLIPESNVLKILERGGILMWPLVFCSVVMMVFVFERVICLRRGNILPRPFVTRFLLQLEDGQLTQAEALKRCQEN